MNRAKPARLLVVLGCAVLVAATAVHWIAGYPGISLALRTSNLKAPLPPALRAVFLMVGWDWLVIAIIALTATLSETRARKLIVLLCGVGTLVSAGIAFWFLAWFVGDEMLGAAGLLMVCGGLLFPSSA